MHRELMSARSAPVYHDCISGGHRRAVGMAQQPPPETNQTPLARPLPGALPCTSFRKNAEGDWVAKQGMMVPGPSGPIQVAAGTVLSEDLQEELDDRCKE